MPPTPKPRRIRSSPLSRAEHRALYARTNADLMVNNPDGFPSAFPPVWWVGSDQAPDLLMPNEAPALAVVNRATSLIVDPIAQSPFTVHDTTAPATQTAQLPVPTWLRDPMLLRPDRRIADPADTFSAVLKLSRTELIRQLLTGALWWGMAGLLFQEQADGQPAAGSLKIVNPMLLGTERADDDSLRWVIGTGPNDPDRVQFDRRGYASFGPVTYRLVVLRNPASPVSTEGISEGVFAMSPGAFRLERSLESYAASTFRSGVPAGVLKTDVPNMTKENADKLRENWLQHHGGDRRSVAVLSSTVSFTPISLSPVDAALVEVRTVAVSDCAFAFGIDPVMLNASMSGSLTYGNTRDYFRQHKQLGIGIWISVLQDLLSSLLPASQEVRVDTDAFTRPEAAERYASYTQALTAGWITKDEVRALEGLGPMPEPVSEPPVPEPAPVAEPDTSPPPVRSLRATQQWRH
jgi:hypothetical protein